MSDNDNFDALWERLKQSVIERREPEGVYTMGGQMDGDHTRFATSDPDQDGDGTPIITVHTGGYRSSFMGYATKEDLINIAEHCLLRAAQMEQQ
jgi:hypothetical protein